MTNINLRERGKERRRQRILEAVQAIICEEGLNGLSAAKIAGRAEVSVATLYNLIGSQETILAQLLEELSSGFASALDSYLGQSTEAENPVARVLAYADATSDFLGRDENTYRAIHRAIFQRNFSHTDNTDIFSARDSSASYLYHSLQRLQADGVIRPAADLGLLVEQMLMSQIILLQNWAVGLIDLERCRLSGRLHLLALLKGWAAEPVQADLEQQLLTLQQQILRHDKSIKRRQRARIKKGHTA